MATEEALDLRHPLCNLEASVKSIYAKISAENLEVSILHPPPFISFYIYFQSFFFPPPHTQTVQYAPCSRLPGQM